MEDNNNAVITKRPPFWACITIVTFLAVILVAQILVFGSPDVHMTMIFALAFSSVVLLLTGTKWDAIEEGIIHGSKIAILPMLILMFIGMLIPTLIACGTIPTLIYYGLQLISPKAFLVTAAIVCSICSIVTGSSWTTGGTFGVAFMAIGAGLGIPGGMTAGAVISGAVIGDKMSPMSDSTNLAPAVAECNIFDHISAMMRTTIPAFIISLVLYFVLGMRFSADSIDQSTFNAILDGISANWDTGALYVLLSIIPLAVVLFMAVKNMSAVATMVVASLVAMVIAMITKGYGIGEMMSFMNYGFVIDTGDAFLNRLLNRGGLQNMLWTCSLGYIALPFGGILETTGVMDVLLEKLQNVTKNAKGLIITHVFSGILVNLLSASQLVSILLPGRLFLPVYKKLHIKNYICSRTCEDSATCTSPLVPWGLCGVTFTAALGVPTMEYLPYAFLCFLVPVVTCTFASLGIAIDYEDGYKPMAKEKK